MSSTSPLRAVPRDDVWLVCPACAGPAHLMRGVVRCIACGWLRTGGTQGAWCACCQQWEGDRPAPASDRYEAIVTSRCLACGRRDTREHTLQHGRHPGPSRCVCGGRRTVESVDPLIDIADGVDALYGLPFWLTNTCAGHQLWAANRAHIDYLRDFLRTPNRPNGSRRDERQLGHRLPGWLLSAKNRSAVLHGLDKLEREADQLPS